MIPYYWQLILMRVTFYAFIAGVCFSSVAWGLLIAILMYRRNPHLTAGRRQAAANALSKGEGHHDHGE